MNKQYKISSFNLEYNNVLNKEKLEELRNDELNKLLSTNTYFALNDDGTYQYYEDVLLENGTYEVNNDTITFNYDNNTYTGSLNEDYLIIEHVNNIGDEKEVIKYIFK